MLIYCSVSASLLQGQAAVVMTLSITTLSVMALTVTPSISMVRRYAGCGIFTVLLNDKMLRVSVQSIMMLNGSMIGIVLCSVIAECYNPLCCYAEYHYAECRMLCVVMLSVIKSLCLVSLC